jgi:uracil-DNA glycosylase
MGTRDDVLRELGLAPRWRLRARGDTAAPALDNAERSRVESPRIESDGGATRVERIARLPFDDLVEDIACCRACSLGASRTCAVPGVGTLGATWMFVGEAPGAEEDARGEPFVGAAGKLLDNMLAALGLSRESDVFIVNVLKCRPPGNRAPAPAEVDACRPYLDRQIELVSPSVIVALGKSAACTLLGVDASVGSLRRRVHRYAGRPLVVTYHPAYLLRTPADKAKAWEDLLFARKTMHEARAAPS